MHLTAADYAVTAVMLVIPLGIGVFYAWKDSKKANKDEYLLGGRRMSILPVTMSLFVTYQSAISIIGYPSDIYQYGPMVVAYYIGSSLGCLSSYFTMIPLMYPLQLTSIYDYLEMRYHSHFLRMFSTLVGMLQTFLYMVTAMLAPGLALQAAAGIPFWLSVATVGSIGTFYTAIGGIKSVIWADAFQILIVLVGLLLLIIRGIVVLGGIDEVWCIAEQGGRTSMTNFSPDPRTRHSWWGMIIGPLFIWQSNVYSQANIQRISAMKSLKSAKLSSLLNVPCHLVYTLLLGAVGIIVYAYFYTIRCDPLEGGIISNMNQVTLYFMLLVFQDFPGLSGFYMATIFSGALSTLSSGINALAANTVEDILAGWLRGFSERTVIGIAKVLVFVYGFAIVGVTYLAKSFQGPVTQLATSVIGGVGSVVVGIFIMGCTVPWANKYGAFVGGFLTLALNLWINIGNLLHGRKIKPLLSPPTDNCSSLTNGSYFHNSSSWSERFDIMSSNITLTRVPSTTDTDDPYEYGFFLYDISYEWYGLIGVVFCSVCILTVSKLTSGQVNTNTNARLILPMLRNYWQLDAIPTTNDNKLDCLHLDT